MQDVEVIETARAAVTALDPTRARLLAELREPASAATLAGRVGLTRQKVNYHLRALESHGLVEIADTRRHGGLTERLLQATAASYVISPDALGEAASDPAKATDRLSARYLIAVGARIVREVGRLARDPAAPTLTVDAEVRLTNRKAFAEELAQLVTELAARHHDDDGEPYRLIVASHPIPQEER
jgi:predicted ArsR family transcriptional regulator